MEPFYYRMQQRGHCHSHKVITQTGNRLIAHTKMHSTFNHLLVGFFFSTLTFLFSFLFLPWWRDNLPPTVVSDDGSENTAGIITIIRQFLSLIRRCPRRLIRRASKTEASRLALEKERKKKTPTRSWAFYTFRFLPPTIKLIPSVHAVREQVQHPQTLPVSSIISGVGGPTRWIRLTWGGYSS